MIVVAGSSKIKMGWPDAYDAYAARAVWAVSWRATRRLASTARAAPSGRVSAGAMW